MRVVVIGATGNVGTRVVQVLSDAGHRVVGVSRRPAPQVRPYVGLPWHIVDVADPAAAVELGPVFTGADAVINLAWGFQPARDREYLRRVGLDGTRAVLAAAQSAGVPHLVHMSSVGAYSPAPRGVAQDESYPTDGIPSSPYSVDKAAAERVLDEYEESGEDGPAVCRVRPGLILQRSAGSSLLRYGLPGWVPAWTIDLALVLPLDPSFSVPVVHTQDVARAIGIVVDRGATGAFNLAASTPLTAPLLAKVLRARLLPVPWRVLRTLVAAAFAARVSRLDPGWIDLAFSVPLLDIARARNELGWEPAASAEAVIREAVQGMRTADSGASAPLRPRSVAAELSDRATAGPIAHRRQS